MNDGPGPAQGLADVRAHPAGALADPVPQAHGGRRHAAGDRVQRLALHVGTQPDPVARQRLAEQRELVTGGVDHVDAHVPVVLPDRLDPALAQLPGRPGHDQPVPAVDERQALLGDAVLQHAGGHELLGQREGRIGSRLPDVRIHVPGVRELAPHVFARLRRGDQLHPRADLHGERKRIRVVQPGLAVREGHDIGEAGEGQVRRERLPLGMFQAQQRPPVVHLPFQEGLDLPRAPGAAAYRRRARITHGAHQGVAEQPRDLVRAGVPRGERAGGQGAAEPLGLIRPAGDLAGRHRLVVEAHHLLARPVGVDELGEDPAGELGAHASLAQPHAQVDLFGPEVLRPHMPVHLVQVVPPARAVVRGGIEPGGPHRRWVGAVRDAQVHLGVGHPDGGERDSDVGGECLPLLGGDELVRLGGQAVVGPRVRLGEQDPVVEVADRQAAASPGPCAHRDALRRSSRSAARVSTRTPVSAV